MSGIKHLNTVSMLMEEDDYKKGRQHGSLYLKCVCVCVSVYIKTFVSLSKEPHYHQKGNFSSLMTPTRISHTDFLLIDHSIM